ncbi:MAG: hypothetical protein R3E95_11825 [Thiolinea sp.]
MQAFQAAHAHSGVLHVQADVRTGQQRRDQIVDLQLIAAAFAQLGSIDLIVLFQLQA